MPTKFYLGEVHGADGKQAEDGEVKVSGKNAAKIAERIAYLVNTHGL